MSASGRRATNSRQPSRSRSGSSSVSPIITTEPLDRAHSSTARPSEAKNGSPMSRITTAIVPVLPRRSIRALSFGV
jgi:hypothetical protein